MPEANELTIHIMATVAQAQRKAISTRIKEALAAAKARGVRLGSNRGNLHDLKRGPAKSAEVRSRQAEQRVLKVRRHSLRHAAASPWINQGASISIATQLPT